MVCRAHFRFNAHALDALGSSPTIHPTHSIQAPGDSYRFVLNLDDYLLGGDGTGSTNPVRGSQSLFKLRATVDVTYDIDLRYIDLCIGKQSAISVFASMRERPALSCNTTWPQHNLAELNMHAHKLAEPEHAYAPEHACTTRTAVRLLSINSPHHPTSFASQPTAPTTDAGAVARRALRRLDRARSSLRRRPSSLPSPLPLPPPTRPRLPSPPPSPCSWLWSSPPFFRWGGGGGGGGGGGWGGGWAPPCFGPPPPPPPPPAFQCIHTSFENNGSSNMLDASYLLVTTLSCLPNPLYSAADGMHFLFLGGAMVFFFLA